MNGRFLLILSNSFIYNIMRIAVSGTACVGKTTVINDVLSRWKTFKTTDISYRHIINKYKDQHSSKTSEQVQNEILEFMIENQAMYQPEDNIIFDRCALDNLVYTLWGVHKGNISSEYADSIIPKVRESLRNIDIIFLIKHDRHISIEQDGVRDTNIEYIKEIDAIFSLIYDDYLKCDETTFTIFPKDDIPAIIEIGGTREQRIAQIADYIDPFGNVIETKPEESVLSPDQIKQMEELVKMQDKFALQDKWGVK